MVRVAWHHREPDHKWRKQTSTCISGENGLLDSVEEFKESGAFYEDRDVVVDGNLVSFREEAFAPLHSNV